MIRLAFILLILVVIGLTIYALRHRTRNQHLERVQLSDFDAGEWRLGAILFSTRYCLPCQLWEEELAVGTLPWVKVEMNDRPDLIAKYGVHSAPDVLVVDRAGRVVRQYDSRPTPAILDELRDLASRVTSQRHNA